MVKGIESHWEIEEDQQGGTPCLNPTLGHPLGQPKLITQPEAGLKGIETMHDPETAVVLPSPA